MMNSRLRAAAVLAAALLALAGCDEGKPFPYLMASGPVHPEPVTPPPTSPLLHIDAISPAAAEAGDAELTITLTGRGFVEATHRRNSVRWFANGHGDYLETTHVSETQLVARVGANLLTVPATAKVSVEIWDVQGDTPQSVSNFVPFTVN